MTGTGAKRARWASALRLACLFVAALAALGQLTRAHAAEPAPSAAPSATPSASAAPSAAPTVPRVVPTAKPLPKNVAPPQGRQHVVVHATLDGGITNGTADFVADALADAEARNAQALVLELDTPGGLLEATRGIVQRILQAPLPVIVYVSPAGARAGSAGVFLVLASHVAAMHPTSNVGAAHPVSAFGGDIEGDMADKVENDTAAWARSLAQSRFRNSEWAEQAVTKSQSLTAREALEMHVVDVLASNVEELLEKADGRIVAVQDTPWRVTTRGAQVVNVDRSLKQKAHALLADPMLVYLLFLLGLLGVYIEFQHPGLILPGLLGGVCLLLVFGVQALPLNSLGVLLIVLSAVLFVAEVYITSFGVLSVLALACLITGSFMLFDVAGSTFRLNPWTVWTTAGMFAAVILFIGGKLLQVRRQGATSGTHAAIGKQAVVWQQIPAGGRGKVLFDGSYWDATSDVALADKAPCRVASIEGLLLHVTPLLPDPPESAPLNET